jgi:hypothetical protein
MDDAPDIIIRPSIEYAETAGKTGGSENNGLPIHTIIPISHLSAPSRIYPAPVIARRFIAGEKGRCTKW